MRAAAPARLLLAVPAALLLTCSPIDPLDPWGLPPPVDTSVSWERTMGGAGEDVVCSVIQASDGGFLLAGWSDSPEPGNTDAWLIKTDRSGVPQWQKYFGGALTDRAYQAVEAPGGGYVLVGYTESLGTGGSADVYLVKTDSSGNEEWHKTFGGTGWDAGWSVACTADGYLVAASTDASGTDVLLIRTDAAGSATWQKQYGSTGMEQPYAVCLTADDGCAVAGDKDGDLLLVKFDKDGAPEWEKTFGREYPDAGTDVQQALDGGYLVSGYTRSFGAGDFNAWLVKTDSAGVEEWNQAYGGNGYDRADGIHLLADGAVLCGLTRGPLWNQAWLIRTNAAGEVTWDRTFGGTDDEWARGVDVTADGGFVLAGTTTASEGGDIDAYLVYFKP